ncbi:molybdenum cofactor biosysynthesis protein [Frigoribacterium sp. CFBP9039]|uniref:MOSC domain-containing protein n=1 Tax=Frigoribacterium sp. CFBP9029 TaxID=3096541 RepID=UPI002A69CC88|nr:MOSC domain-containing protein [Frigoribacterium sp. CFBP9039]MDY0946180.1 molybdenum cofactor biosysynthesis protein [Frigoribacterium sp. CFBP9039]
MHEEARVGTVTSVTVELLLASPRSRYVGRPSDGPEPATGVETHDRLELRAGLGVVGDRYFARPAHRAASVTVFAAESLETVASLLGSGPLDAAATRRNIVLRGVDVDALTGLTFSLDSGDGPVLLRANRPANPCAWMDVVLAPGAFRALRGRGGIRCEPLTSGALRLGPATLAVLGEGDGAVSATRPGSST